MQRTEIPEWKVLNRDTELRKYSSTKKLLKYCTVSHDVVCKKSLFNPRMILNESLPRLEFRRINLRLQEKQGLPVTYNSLVFTDQTIYIRYSRS